MTQDRTVCKTCGIKLTDENRYKHKPRHCIPCVKVKQKDQREKHKDKRKVYIAATKEQRSAWQKDYYQKNKETIIERTSAHIKDNRERYTGYLRKYRAENPELAERGRVNSREYNRQHKEERKQYNSRYVKENKDKINAQLKIRRKENPNIFRVQLARYRARRKGIPGIYTVADVEEMWVEQLGRCVYCKCSLHDNYHADHIIPVTREGSTNWPSNMQLLCPPCNTSKGNKTHEEYLEYQAKYKTRPVVL